MKSEVAQLLSKLSTYLYGILYRDGKFVSDKEEMDRRDGTDIIVQTPEMMDEHRAGMCHDASIYVDEVLTELEVEHKCIYIASNVEPMLPTHSFIIMHDSSGFGIEADAFYVIDVFASKDCIWKKADAHTTDMTKLIEERVASWIRDDNRNSADLEVFILEHMPEGGRGFLEYSKEVVDSAADFEFSYGYSHIEYEGTGVYQALKRACGWDWKNVIATKDVSWLPKPPEYDGSCKSYFTMKGYRKFREKVMPLVEKYLDASKIREEYVEHIDEKAVVYSDELQVVVRRSSSKFDRIFEEVMKHYGKSSSPILHLNELIENKHLFRHGQFTDGYELKNLGITDEILTEAVNDILNESDDPEYYVKLPKELVDFTRKFNDRIADKYDILALFPEFEKFSFPAIYVKFFDFSDKTVVKNVIESFSDLGERPISTMKFSFISASTNRGCHVFFNKFGINVACLFFNSKLYNERTIYHEWTHFFQTYVGDEFKKLIEISMANREEKNRRLEKFGLSMDVMQWYFFTEKEYIAHLDNVLYMLHQAQKLPRYNKMSDEDFFSIFKKDICEDELNSSIARDIMSIDNNFKIDLLFFIVAYICFDGDVFEKLCRDLMWRL